MLAANPQYKLNSFSFKMWCCLLNRCSAAIQWQHHSSWCYYTYTTNWCGAIVPILQLQLEWCYLSKNLWVLTLGTYWCCKSVAPLQLVLLALKHHTYWWYRYNSTNWSGAIVVVAPNLLVVFNVSKLKFILQLNTTNRCGATVQRQ